MLRVIRRSEGVAEKLLQATNYWKNRNMSTLSKKW